MAFERPVNTFEAYNNAAAVARDMLAAQEATQLVSTSIPKEKTAPPPAPERENIKSKQTRQRKKKKEKEKTCLALGADILKELRHKSIDVKRPACDIIEDALDAYFHRSFVCGSCGYHFLGKDSDFEVKSCPACGKLTVKKG